MEQIISIIKEYVAMAGTDGVAGTLWMLWVVTVLPTMFVPWTNPCREIAEDITQCFITAAFTSALCSAYVNEVISLGWLAAGVILAVVSLVAVARMNSSIAAARREAAPEETEKEDAQIAEAKQKVKDAAKDVKDRLKEIWEDIKDSFGW